MADEENVIAVFLNDTLNDGSFSGTVPGRFHWEIAKSGSVYPNGSYQLFDPGIDLVVINNVRVYSNQLWLIKVSGIAGVHDALLTQAVTLLDEKLSDVRWVSVGGAMVYQGYREAPHSLPVVENGTHYRQRGGLYRFRVRDAA